VADPAWRRDFRPSDMGSSVKSALKGPHPLPPPPWSDKQAVPLLPNEKTLCEGKSVEEKLRALRAYRRPKGLCVKCAAKWSRDHTCAPTVQLHAIQEVLELFDMDDLDDTGSVHSQAPSHLFMTLSVHAATGTEGPRTMRLQGSILGQQLLILVDSGSSHTFLSRHMVSHLVGVIPADQPLKVQIANGDVLSCSSVLPQGSWSMGGCQFTADLKILPLHHYDMIIGMDWLEVFSPMKVHWKFKWMAIPYKGAQVLLQGIVEDSPSELLIHISDLC